MMDWVIAILIVVAAVLAVKPLFRYDRKVMRNNTDRYNREYYADKKPRQF